LTEHERTDPIGSRNPNTSATDHHRDDSITSTTTAIERAHGGEHISGVTRGVPTRCNSEASTFNNTSESDEVLR
jgi:hypothetical protein